MTTRIVTIRDNVTRTLHGIEREPKMHRDYAQQYYQAGYQHAREGKPRTLPVSQSDDYDAGYHDGTTDRTNAEMAS